MSERFQWTPELIEQAWTRYNGGESAGSIARDFGCTRNAMMSKVQKVRIKLGIPPRGQTKPRASDNPNPPKRRITLPKFKPSLDAPLEGKPIRLVKMHLHKGKLIGILNVTGCRWPVADNPKVIGGLVFCNAKKRDGSSYCCEHAALNRASYSRELIRKTVKATLHVLKKRAA